MASKRKLVIRIEEQFGARIVPGADRHFDHWFGGPPVHTGVRFRNSATPLHLVYSLDLRDPAVGVTWPLAPRLPLYYGFRFDGAQCGYRVVNEHRITLLTEPGRLCDDFPYANYPREFPRIRVRTSPLQYEDAKLMLFCDAFSRYSLGTPECALSARDNARLQRLGHPFSQVGEPMWLMQGRPHSACPDPKCRSRYPSWKMETIAVVCDTPAPGVSLWGGNCVQVVFELCTRCGAILASNQCD